MANLSIWTSHRVNGSTDTEWTKECIIELLDLQIKQEKERLNREDGIKSLFELEKMEIKTIKVDSLYSFPSGYESTSYYGKPTYDTEQKITDVCNKAIRRADSILEAAKVQHEANIPAIENNKLIADGISKLMDKFGIYDSWKTTEYKSYRSKPKETTHSQQWSGAVNRYIKTNDEFSSIERQCNSHKETVEKWRTEKLKELVKLQQLAEQELKQKQATMELARFQVKYDLPADSDWNDLLELVLEKNKYLHLAHYLEKNRNDWSDGYWCAKTGLTRFLIESEQDQQINDDIQRHIDDWGGDGRCFRDTTWSYDVIYGLVEDETLMADYQTIQNYTF